MKRNVSLEEISDGRLYGVNDMVKADCRGCEGCFQCCTGMGSSVILDPLDVYRMQKGLGKGLRELLAEGLVELNVADGVILPNLKMTGRQERCVFLDGNGRCGIHESRPGICRLFPLGRYYENGDFKFFLQTKECRFRSRSKVKVSKWIDTPEQARNHDFICAWHTLQNRIGEAAAWAAGEADDAAAEASVVKKKEMEMEEAKRLNLTMLQTFYLEPYDVELGFYEQFAERMQRFEEEAWNL